MNLYYLNFYIHLPSRMFIVSYYSYELLHRLKNFAYSLFYLTINFNMLILKKIMRYITKKKQSYKSYQEVIQYTPHGFRLLSYEYAHMCIYALIPPNFNMLHAT